MEKTIDKFHPIITIELGDMNVEDVPTSKELIKFLIDKGYQAYEYKDGKILPHVIRDELYSYMIIFFWDYALDSPTDWCSKH
jgi:hypothetical protein